MTKGWKITAWIIRIIALAVTLNRGGLECMACHDNKTGTGDAERNGARVRGNGRRGKGGSVEGVR